MKLLYVKSCVTACTEKSGDKGGDSRKSGDRGGDKAVTLFSLKKNDAVTKR